MGKNYGGSGFDKPYSVLESPYGGYIIVGESNSNDGDVGNNYGNIDCWVVKIDLTGNIEWEKNYGGSGLDIAHSIITTQNGGYVIAGQSVSDDQDVGGNNGSRDFWIVKIDPIGNIEWEHNYGGTMVDEPQTIIETSEDEYVILGSSRSSDGDISNNYGSVDIWIIKIGKMITSNNVNLQKPKNELIIYPNPSSGNFQLEIDNHHLFENLFITDALGNIVFFESNLQKYIEVKKLIKGIYWVNLKNSKYSISKKIIIQ